MDSGESVHHTTQARGCSARWLVTIGPALRLGRKFAHCSFIGEHYAISFASFRAHVTIVLLLCALQEFHLHLERILYVLSTGSVGDDPERLEGAES
jgi:hypothetical protein